MADAILNIALPAIERGTENAADGEVTFNLYLKLGEVLSRDNEISSSHEGQFYQVFENCHADWAEVIHQKATEQVPIPRICSLVPGQQYVL